MSAHYSDVLLFFLHLPFFGQENTKPLIDINFL